MSQILGNNPEEIRSLLKKRIQKLEESTTNSSDYLRDPIKQDEPLYPSEVIEKWQKQGIAEVMSSYNDLMRKAVFLKRQGNLKEADAIYCDILKSQIITGQYDKDFLWGWCKILMLAKDFKDLDLVIEYLHTCNVRENLLRKEHGDQFEAYRMMGKEPELSFAFDHGSYLKRLCDCELSTKEEAQQRFSEYGGSALWNNYRLSNEEYADLNKYFRLESKPNSVSKPSNLSSTSSSGGCYIATAIYGSYDCPQVWTLRRFRDESLSQTLLGRVFISIYYALSPKLVSRFGGKEWFNNLFRKPLDRFVAKCNKKGFSNTPYNDK